MAAASEGLIKFYLFIKILILLCWPTSNSAEFVCPSPSKITPCRCSLSAGNPAESFLYCGDYFISQGIIDNALSQVRIINNLTSNEWLHIDKIMIEHTYLQTLNLTKFSKFSIRELVLYWNLKLNTLIPATDSQDQIDIDDHRLNVTNLQLTFNNLDDKSVASIFKFMVPTQILNISLELNNVTGTLFDEDHPGFLPYLDSFTNLEHLDLSVNPITRFGGGQFKNNTRLKSLTYFMGSHGTTHLQLASDAFLFNDAEDEDMVNETLSITIIDNYLNDDGMATDHGLERSKRPLNINFQDNEFIYLSRDKFENFLRADDRHQLDMRQNHFICDGRMKWLKDGRSDFEHRCLGLECINDPGQTIFTTDLV